MAKQTLLVVDDELDNLDALERIFRKRYQFLRANSGHEALALLANTPDVDVIITDQRMPQMTGVELLEKTLISHPKTVRILLTGYTDIDSIIAAVNQGHIFRYITKPWDTTDLSNSVEQAMEHYARGHQLEIKNRELEDALSELKILDQAKSKFMILINHELKTPLTVINSFLGLLLETSLDDEQTTYLDRIKKSTLRLQEVIDDTLVLTHHAAGILKLNLQSGSVYATANSCLEDLTEEANKKSIEFNISNQGGPVGNLNFDFALLKRAIRHLINNAIRFAPNNSTVKITFSIEGSTQTVSIENPGTPIPTHFIEKLNIPFNLQSEIMNHSKGLGLGLSVSDAILQAHKSRLKIENVIIQDQTSAVRVSFSLHA